jgi:Ca2+-binding RTX toxin-like protein
MVGGAGNDTFLVDNAADVTTELSSGGTDTVMASVNYALVAGSSIEFLRANAGATGLHLTGNELANRLVGNAGDDTLNGGAGDDSLGGGAGNDVFAFLAGFGNDTITDFDANPTGGQDLIDLVGLGITHASFAGSVTITGVANTLISVGGGTIRLNGVAASTVDITDFKLLP